MKTNLYTKIINAKVFFVVALLFVLYQCDVNPRMDDAILAEQAYWLSNTGYVKSELMRGYNGIGLESYQAVFHKFSIYNGALFISIFGWSLFSVHLVSFFYLALFLIVFYKYIMHFYPLEKDLFLGTIMLLFLNYEFIYDAGSFRPEIQLMSIGFCSFYALRLYLQKNQIGHLFFAALFAGLANLTHLNGLIFIAAGFILLVWHKKYLPSFLFGAIASSVFLGGYFIDILQNRNLDYFLFQFKNDPSLSSTDFKWYSPLIKLIDEQVRFLYNEKEIFYTLAIASALVFSFKYLKAKMPQELLYLLVLIITMGAFTYSKSPQYLVTYSPFLALVLINGWKFIENSGHSYQRIIVRLMLIISVSISLYSVALKIGQNMFALTQSSSQEKYAAISKLIPEPHKNLTVLAPNEFVFHEIEQYKSVQGLNKYTWYGPSHGLPKTTFTELLDSAKKYEVDYIVLPRHELDDARAKGIMSQQMPAYHFIDSLDDVYLIRLD